MTPAGQLTLFEPDHEAAPDQEPLPNGNGYKSDIEKALLEGARLARTCGCSHLVVSRDEDGSLRCVMCGYPPGDLCVAA
jgi:hypothetical protein